ncbi:Cytochrome P450 71D7 [Platanthera guangdongensis]|uniref:Cytochrome P450 71D7 n=1 Tax=Platanthera guangdongensis TaxID=2320717 RepID=A0ABR2MCZ6_9ASPA
MVFFYNFVYLFITFILLFAAIRLQRHFKKPINHRLPPGPFNFPFIGATHRMLSSRPAHHTLRQLSAVHGPIMYLRLGEIPTVVISSAEAAKLILKTHDRNFASRSITISVQIITKGVQDLTFAPYGEFWRQMRRICVVSLLCPKRTRSYKTIRAEEIHGLLRSIEASCAGGSPDVSINLSEKVALLTNRITVRAAIGDEGKIDQDLFLRALGEVKEAISGFSIADLFPSAPVLATLTGFRRRLQRCHDAVERMLDVILEEHRGKTAGDEDLLDVLLRCQRDESLPLPISDDNIKGVLNDIFAGGSETAATTVEWAMSELIRSLSAMKRAQMEVREDAAGNNNRLRYMHLIIKETLRLHPPVPLLLPRECHKTCEVMGYEIPERTRVMVNVWAIGRDPKYWEEPEAFKPERFENNVRELGGADFELLPFGAGRRMCPGVSFGLEMVEIALANLLYYFDWEYSKVGDDELNMSENFGVTVGRKFPLHLRASQRFPIIH